MYNQINHRYSFEPQLIIIFTLQFTYLFFINYPLILKSLHPFIYYPPLIILPFPKIIP